MKVLELALDNVGFMSKFPHNPCDFNSKFRKEEKKVKDVKRGGGSVSFLAKNIHVLHNLSNIPGVQVSVPPSLPKKQLCLLPRKYSSGAVAVSGVFSPAPLEDHPEFSIP